MRKKFTEIEVNDKAGASQKEKYTEHTFPSSLALLDFVFAYSFSRFASSALRSRKELAETPAARALSPGAMFAEERREIKSGEELVSGELQVSS